MGSNMRYRARAVVAGAFLAIVLLSGLTSGALAQNFPTRQITLLLGFPPGGGTDGPSRLIAEKMSASLGVPVVVDNRPGANQMVAIRALMAAPPDGYTLLVGTGSSLAQNPGLSPDIGYDPLKDFTPIARFGSSSAAIVVGPSLKVQTLKEFVEYAKANPGKLSYASGGIGAAGHLSMELLMNKLGIKMEHIPYKGDGPAIVDISEGRVHVMMASYNTLPAFKDKVKMLVSTAPSKLPYAAGVPTLSEAGMPELAVIDPYTFFGIVGPRNMPADIVAKLAKAVNDATQLPEVQSFFREKLYTEPVTESPAQFKAYVEQQFGKWRALAGQIAIPK